MGQQCGLGFAEGPLSELALSCLCGQPWVSWDAVLLCSLILQYASQACSWGSGQKEYIWLRMKTFSLLPHSMVKGPRGQPGSEE